MQQVELNVVFLYYGKLFIHIILFCSRFIKGLLTMVTRIKTQGISWNVAAYRSGVTGYLAINPPSLADLLVSGCLAC